MNLTEGHWGWIPCFPSTFRVLLLQILIPIDDQREGDRFILAAGLSGQESVSRLTTYPWERSAAGTADPYTG